ncbi:MAG: hypothetical protein R2750_08485 [Bacteroidales bacterium]
MLIVNATASQVFFSWASTTPVSIGSGTLIEYNFKTGAGISTTVSWNTQTPGSCEYSDPDGNIFVMSFVNGSISTAANALTVDAGDDENIPPGGSVQLNGSFTGGTGPYSILWSPATGLSNPAILNPLANPTGTMVYTLTITDNNFCIGSDVMTVHLTTAGIDLNLKALLEGPFATNEMATGLNSGNVIPLSQPYSGAPWNYAGTEYVGTIPNGNIVDWVLVELRETSGGASTATAGTRIARKAGFLLKDGTITGTDGTNPMHIDVFISQNLYVVIWHRNHLPVMSANALTNIGSEYSYDFTTGAGQAYGTNAQANLGSVYGLYAGDADASGIINLADKTNGWAIQVGKKGYFSGDFDMNSHVMNQDKNDLWNGNLNKQEQVPD